jgi:hypothetical protein
VPPEDNIESACEMITICGKKLAESSEKGTKDKLEAYMHRLGRLTENKDLSSRIRFIVRSREGWGVGGQDCVCQGGVGVEGQWGGGCHW